MKHDFVWWALMIATVAAFTVVIAGLGFLVRNALTKKRGDK